MRRFLVGVAMLGASVGPGSAARATECGDLRLQATNWKAAAAVEQQLNHSGTAREAKTQLEKVERKIQQACAPKTVTIAALPLGYLAVPPGTASRAAFDPPEKWRPQFTTAAGAQAGILFAEPASLDVPRNMHWEADARAVKAPGDVLVAVVEGAKLTVEEPQAGRGTWRISTTQKPTLVASSQLRLCAQGKPADLGGLKLSQPSCQMLARVDPLGAVAGALPERGRAMLVGEWQYGPQVTLDLGSEELADLSPSGSEPSVPLTLDLSAPIPGVSDGKHLVVTAETNRLPSGGGATFKLSQECAAGDAACEKQWFAEEVWFDRAFGVPFLRAPSTGGTGTRIVGRIADRLERTIVGQRVLVDDAGRHVVTMTNSDGDYRFDGMPAGQATVFPVARHVGDRPAKPDQAKRLLVGSGEAKAPTLLIDKLFE